MSLVRRFKFALGVGAALLTAAMASNASAVQLTGAGSTFDNPIFTKWFYLYHQAHPDVQINYQSIGSGGGIQQITQGTVDFGASDGPMTEEQIKRFEQQQGCSILHLPVVIGGEVPIFNIPGVNVDMNFTGKALADIYLGKVTNWSDPEITSSNPGVNLPNQDIVVVHRADGSGTTYCFTNFLSVVSPQWAKQCGYSTSINWPVGLGGKGSEGVSGIVQQTPDSIGYDELNYAIVNHITYGHVQDRNGEYVNATLDTVTADAAEAAKHMPKDFRVSIVDAAGPGCYPLSTFSWMLVPTVWHDAAKEQAMVDFLNWMLTDGQKLNASLYYAPLPANVVQMELEAIKQIHVAQ
jgi:phosphate transport system substrate-binding protein